MQVYFMVSSNASFVVVIIVVVIALPSQIRHLFQSEMMSTDMGGYIRPERLCEF